MKSNERILKVAILLDEIIEIAEENGEYKNLKEKFNPNEFVQQIKFTFRLLGIESEWSK